MIREVILAILLGVTAVTPGCKRKNAEAVSLEDRLDHAKKLFWSGKEEESVKELEKVLAKNPSSLPVLHTLIWAYAKIGEKHSEQKRFEETLVWYKKSIGLMEEKLPEEKEKLSYSYYCLGGVYQCLVGQWHERWQQSGQQADLDRRQEFGKQMILAWHKALDYNPENKKAEESLERYRVK